jgi:XTP/dITP diphosphohydrolase
MLKKYDKLVIASHNQGKIHEIKILLELFTLEVISAADLGIPEPEETGSTFVENSVLKAVEVMKHCNLPCLADDSGLSVDDL